VLVAVEAVNMRAVLELQVVQAAVEHPYLLVAAVLEAQERQVKATMAHLEIHFLAVAVAAVEQVAQVAVELVEQVHLHQLLVLPLQELLVEQLATAKLGPQILVTEARQAVKEEDQEL
jgi:hypothetical protein